MEEELEERFEERLEMESDGVTDGAEEYPDASSTITCVRCSFKEVSHFKTYHAMPALEGSTPLTVVRPGLGC